MSEDFDDEELFFDAEEGAQEAQLSRSKSARKTEAQRAAKKPQPEDGATPLSAVPAQQTEASAVQSSDEVKELSLPAFEAYCSKRDLTEEEIEEAKYKIINKDTGEVIDIREFDAVFASQQYSLFPTREEIQNGKLDEMVSENSEEPETRPKSVFKGFGKVFRRPSSAAHSAEDGSINVQANKKEAPYFQGLRLGQTLQSHTGPVWVMKFSVDGHYLATAGQDHVVLVWRVLGAQEQQAQAQEGVDGHESKSSERASNEFQLLEDRPMRRYSDHSSDVVDIAWSKTNFLLSASIDKTVRLWHISRDDCLQFFKHADFVTSVDFHPTQDRYFVTGCFDKKIRVWDVIPDGHVKEWAQAPEMVTSVSFSPDGSMVVAGLYHGQVYFYQYDGMRYYTQIECRNRHGQHKMGRKVTGLAFPPQPATRDVSPRRGTRSGLAAKLLVTTNDSRLRLYQMEDYSMICKYKGLRNDAMQIKGSFSDDGRYVICGSENGSVYIWHTVIPPQPSMMAGFSKRGRNKFYETFDAASGVDGVSITTVAIFAPSLAVQTAMTRHGVSFPRSSDNEDTSGHSVILTADYAGVIKVFHKPTQPGFV